MSTAIRPNSPSELHQMQKQHDETVKHSPCRTLVSDQFIVNTGDTALAILLNKESFEPNAAVFAFHEASTCKDTWGMVVLVVRGLGALEDSNHGCAGFLIMPKRSYEWYVDAHGCYKFNDADLALGPRDTSAHLPAFLHLRTTKCLGPDSITLSDQAERLECKAAKHTHPASSFLMC